MENQDLAVQHEISHNPETEVQATNFEKSLLMRTKRRYIGASGALDRKKIDSRDCPHLVTTVATNGPEDASSAEMIVDRLVQKGVHQVEGYGRVLFVDCSPSLQEARDREPMHQTRNRVAKAVLSQILESIDNKGIDLQGYEGLDNSFQLQQLFKQTLGLDSYPDLVFKLIESLGTGKKGFLGQTKDHLHVIPVFNFGRNTLPLANSAEFGQKDSFDTVSDELAKEAAHFYKLATAVRLLAPGGIDGGDGYGPYGRTVVVPEMVLHILEMTGEWGEYPNVISEVAKINAGEKLEELDRIRSYNDFLLEDMVSGKIDYSVGHAGFRKPRGSHNW